MNDKTMRKNTTRGDNAVTDGISSKNDEMTVIEERMPPATAETLQVHAKSRQFFYIAATFGNFHRGGVR
jgi:hypothetical protein